MALSGLVRRVVTAKAVAGAGRGWSALATVLFGLRLLRRAMGREERVILREELREGQSLVITHLNRPR